MDEATAGNGHQDVRVIRVKLRAAPEWAMPAEVARKLIETLARDEPVKFGRHLQAALMGDMPDQPGRKRAGE